MFRGVCACLASTGLHLCLHSLTYGSDWAGGFRRFNSDIPEGATIVVGTNQVRRESEAALTLQGIHARVRKHPSKLIIKSVTSDGVTHGPFSVPMRKKVAGGWFSIDTEGSG